MNCLSDNQIQAYLDGEVSASEAARLAEHMTQCRFCKAAYERLEANDQFCQKHIGGFLEALDTTKTEMPLAPILPIENHLNRNKGAKNNMKAYKKYLLTACAVGLVVGGLTVEPVRATVSDMVSIFRAQDIKTVDISLADLKALEEGIAKQEGKIDIENLAKIEQKGSEFKTISLAEAQSSVNFPLSDLAGLQGKTPKEVNLSTEGKIDFTLNIENVNNLMKTLGAEKLFDSSLDGKTFSIYTPGSISMYYETDAATHKGITYSQTKFPEVTAPQGTNVQDLVASIASLGILPSELQSQLKSMTDINNTLYLPNIDGSLETIDVNGIKVYGSFESGVHSYGSAMWMENGIVKALYGDFTKEDLTKLIKGE